jgi:endonuclease I
MRYLVILFVIFVSNTYSQSDFGSSFDPTYGIVQASIPQDYYQEANGKSSEQLKEALHQIISNHTVFPYTSSSTDTWDILQLSDQDPENHDNMILVYTGRSQDKGYRDGSGNYSQYENGNGTQNNSWNREHVWPKSHGFPDEDDNAYTDVHNLKPSDRSVNSSRGTKDYDYGGSQHSEASDCLTDSDSWEPSDFVKGDIARILFYMVVRYDPGYDHNNNSFDLELVDYTTPGNNDPILGKLSSLIQWHFDDPVDDFEINRNEVIFGFQQNRNPFIDHPNLVNFLWGENIGQSWNENLSVNNVNLDEDLIIFPNPSNGILNFTEELQNEKIEIFSLTGQKVFGREATNINSLKLNLNSGIYLLKVSNNHRVINSKIIIK